MGKKDGLKFIFLDVSKTQVLMSQHKRTVDYEMDSKKEKLRNINRLKSHNALTKKNIQ